MCSSPNNNNEIDNDNSTIIATLIVMMMITMSIMIICNNNNNKNNNNKVEDYAADDDLKKQKQKGKQNDLTNLVVWHQRRSSRGHRFRVHFKRPQPLLGHHLVIHLLVQPIDNCNVTQRRQSF